MPILHFYSELGTAPAIYLIISGTAPQNNQSPREGQGGEVEIYTRIAPVNTPYGVREAPLLGYWAVTVPHEHGPFVTAEEAWEFLRLDAEV